MCCHVIVTWPYRFCHVTVVNSQSEARILSRDHSQLSVTWTINLPILVTWLSTWYSNRPITAKEIITWYHVLSRDCHMTLSVLSRDRSQQPIRGQDFVTWPQSTANQRPECAPSYRVKGVPNAHNILLTVICYTHPIRYPDSYSNVTPITLSH